MLRELKVRNLAIIEAADLAWDAGYTAVTGETGAGKSILLNALKFILGAKVKADLVRAGADKLRVEAVFDVPDIRVDAVRGAAAALVALLDNPATTWPARVREISPGADPVTRTYQAKDGLMARRSVLEAPLSERFPATVRVRPPAFRMLPELPLLTVKFPELTVVKL
jgi:multidrug efflux pump subunit AcrA (membrane-fusion protein)